MSAPRNFIRPGPADARRADGAGPRPPARSDSAGEALAPALRQRFEPLFGADFSAVRIHADTRSDAATRAVDADAFTAGSHLHFASGRWQPESETGQRLLGHELAPVNRPVVDATGAAP